MLLKSAKSILVIAIFVAALAACWAEAQEWSGYVTCDGHGWQLIRSQQDFDKFIERVPRERLQKRQPAPPSGDPILEHPQVDFQEYSLVAVWSHNWAIVPRIDSSNLEGNDLKVELVYHTPKDYRNYQAPNNHGRYLVMQVPKVSGELKVRSRAEIK